MSKARTSKSVAKNQERKAGLRRSYKQNCALARASDLLCERWTLLIIRELLIQPCRFKDLNVYLEGMGTNLLAQRLKDLEAAQIIEKQNSEDKRSAYVLTEQGRAVEPAVLSMVAWAFQYIPAENEGLGSQDQKHFHHWDLLAMKALFKPDKIDRRLSVQFETDELLAWVEVSKEDFVFSLDEKRPADINLSITIKELQDQINQQAVRGDQLMLDFLACFAV